MPACIRPWVVAVMGTVSSAGMACSLVPPDTALLQQMMVKEIAYRLGIKVQQVDLTDFTPPQLHLPWVLGADCSGRGALHHSAGFRVMVIPRQQVFTTMGGPYTASGAGARYRKRLTEGRYGQAGRWPGAGVRPNYWRAPDLAAGQGVKDQVTVDYSGYGRWPQYPTEKQFAPPPPAPTVERWPQYLRDPAPPAGSDSLVAPQSQRWSVMGAGQADPSAQGACTYEGVAVILGYDDSSPVAVNYAQRCDAAP